MLISGPEFRSFSMDRSLDSTPKTFSPFEIPVFLSTKKRQFGSLTHEHGGLQFKKPEEFELNQPRGFFSESNRRL